MITVKECIEKLNELPQDSELVQSIKYYLEKYDSGVRNKLNYDDYFTTEQYMKDYIYSFDPMNKSELYDYSRLCSYYTSLVGMLYDLWEIDDLFEEARKVYKNHDQIQR